MEEIDAVHPYAELIGIRMESKGDGRCTCSVEFREALLNPNDVVHGGVIYSMADNSMGGALQSLLKENEFCATIEIKIMYLHAAGHSDLVCHSEVIKRGRRVAVLESDIYSAGKLVAKASGSFAVFYVEPA
jgi:acyl-CoA thioesterase